ncbi:MAG: CmcJ/NvfI family oxidoreductase [Alphaproteobacteria bacterium]
MSEPNPRAEAEVRAPLTFIVPQDSKPSFHSAALTGGLPKIFFETEDREVTIRDMRPLADGLSLDRQGFELRHHQTAVADLYDDAAIEDAYEPEIEALLKAATGAHHVVIFDHTRRSDAVSGADNPDGPRGPANRVHVDYTVASGPLRAADTLGAEAVERRLASGGRIVQVNVWRPITGPVRRTPLALADAASVKTEELVATDQVFPDRVGEIYQVAHGSEQRWYWAPRMERDEVLLIKGWDSLNDGRAQFTPHGAFPLPDQSPDAPARESIETRTYLVFEG